MKHILHGLSLLDLLKVSDVAYAYPEKSNVHCEVLNKSFPAEMIQFYMINTLE